MTIFIAGAPCPIQQPTAIVGAAFRDPRPEAWASAPTGRRTHPSFTTYPMKEQDNVGVPDIHTVEATRRADAPRTGAPARGPRPTAGAGAPRTRTRDRADGARIRPGRRVAGETARQNRAGSHDCRHGFVVKSRAFGSRALGSLPDLAHLDRRAEHLRDRPGDLVGAILGGNRHHPETGERKSAASDRAV